MQIIAIHTGAPCDQQTPKTFASDLLEASSLADNHSSPFTNIETISSGAGQGCIIADGTVVISAGKAGGAERF